MILCTCIVVLLTGFGLSKERKKEEYEVKFNFKMLFISTLIYKPESLLKKQQI